MKYDFDFEYEKLRFEISYRTSKILGEGAISDLYNIPEELDKIQKEIIEWKSRVVKIIEIMKNNSEQ